MANRTTYTEVKEITDTALEDAEVTSIIGYANRMVTAVLGVQSLSDALLKDIETYLSAHLISVGKERQASEEKVEEMTIKYTGKYGEFLKMTSHGQMVLMLDSSGKFADVGKQQIRIVAIAQYPKNYE